MDNRVFNINGEGDEMLKRVIKLAFEQSGFDECVAWWESNKYGLVLLWHTSENSFPMPSPLDAEQSAIMASAWLNGKFARNVELDDWDADMDHDGDNGMGWRVYCEDWGHVGHDSRAIVAIKPAFMWYGK
jgi:hypothetical protein